MVKNNNDQALPLQRLLSNIIDQIKEAQIKLGYAKESVRLYYPVSSLKALSGIDADTAETLVTELNKSFPPFSKALGGIEFFVCGERVEAVIPSQGAEYVYTRIPTPPFLMELIEFFKHNHSCSLKEIGAVFEKYSKNYTCRKMPSGMDFDYVLYFEEGKVDPYYYCIKEEMGHTIYHRFTKEDYEQLL